MAEDYNARTITEFRTNHGKVGGFFEGKPLLLLHTKGARTGKTHVVPVMYLRDGARYFVFASNGGAARHPDWYYNLRMHPDIQVEIGDDKVDVQAGEVLGAEHDEVYRRQSELYPQFLDYQLKAKRTIPVMSLTPQRQS